MAEDGSQLGIMEIGQALDHAQNAGLDLVEVAPTARPPVCKIMDYGKFQYQQQKKEQEARKKQTTIQVKEVKFRPKTDDHDLETKIRHARRFLEAGNRCKMTVSYRGRELAYKDRGKEVLDKVFELLKDVAKIDQEARFEGRAMFMLLSPLGKRK